MDERKASVLIEELRRLVQAARANDTVVDLSVRRTPGPITDDEFEEFVTALGRLEDRSFTLVDKTQRHLLMTRRGR